MTRRRPSTFKQRCFQALATGLLPVTTAVLLRWLGTLVLGGW